MKPTQIAELIANIKATFVSFFSILMFVALGVGVFTGLYWAGPALQGAAESVFDDSNFQSFQVTYPYGYTEDQLEEFLSIDGVDEVEGTYSAYETYRDADGDSYTVKVQSLTDTINTLMLTEGNLPESADQVVLKSSTASSLGLAVGDEITLGKDGSLSESASGDAYLKQNHFTIVGLAESPEYIARSSSTYGYAPVGDGSINAVLWALPEAFDADAFQGGYPSVVLLCNDLAAIGTYAAAYKDASKQLENDIQKLADQLADQRFADLKDENQRSLDDARKQLEDGRSQLAEGQNSIDAAESELSTQSSELDQAQGVYDELEQAQGEAAEAYRAGLAEINSAMAQAKSAMDQANAAVTQAQEAVAQLQAALAQTDPSSQEYAALSAQLTEAQDALTQAQAAQSQAISAYNQIVKAHNELVEDYSNASGELNAQLNELSGQLNDGRSQLASAQDELASKKDELAQSQDELDEKAATLDDSQADLDAMKQYPVTVTPRTFNGGYIESSLYATVTNQLSFSMAALFVIVGLLVTYSAVSRIVHEQIVEIGTKKALGVRGGEITTSFLVYSGLAVVIGSLLGYVVALFIVQGIISSALAGRFIFPPYAPYFDIWLALLVTGVELALVLISTWVACRSVLKEQAIELLKGEKPPAGKTRFFERWKLWDRLPLYTQTIINNCLNDKRRVFSTIVGVAGCTALVVTAITLNNDVLDSYDLHYQDVYNYDSVITLHDADDEEIAALQQELADHGVQATPVYRQTKAVELSDGDFTSVKLVVPANWDEFAQLYHLNVQGDSTAADGQPDEVVLVSEAYAANLGGRVGDNLTINGTDGSTYEIPIGGFYEFYLTNNEAVLSPALYESTFDTDFTPNALLVNRGDLSPEDLEALVQDSAVVNSVVNEAANAASLFHSFSEVSQTVVLIYLALSVVMAIVVLLNLNVMFIEEKKRDLIVLMINGFSVSQAKRYIYNDTILLTSLGIIVGVVLGCLMGSVSIWSMETSSMYFYSGINWPAVGIGIGTSAVLAFVMSVIALRRIPRFNLTDINKL